MTPHLAGHDEERDDGGRVADVDVAVDKGELPDDQGDDVGDAVLVPRRGQHEPGPVVDDPLRRHDQRVEVVVQTRAGRQIRRVVHALRVDRHVAGPLVQHRRRDVRGVGGDRAVQGEGLVRAHLEMNQHVLAYSCSRDYQSGLFEPTTRVPPRTLAIIAAGTTLISA